MRIILDQHEIMEIAGHFFDHWPNQKALDWFKQLFPYFDKKGFFVCYSEIEEKEKEATIPLFALIYTELCDCSAWHEFPNYNYWKEERFVEIDKDCKEFLTCTLDEKLEQIMEILREVGYSEIYELFWRNCEEGSSELIQNLDMKSKLYVNIKREDENCYYKGLSRFENIPFTKNELNCSLFL